MVVVVPIVMIMLENINAAPAMIYWPAILIPILLLAPVVLYLMVSIITGARVRRANEDATCPETLIDSDEELTSQHHLILDFVDEIPANEGITRKQISDHMSSKGVPISRTKVLVSELVGAGYLEEVSIGRYVPGEVQRKHRT